MEKLLFKLLDSKDYMNIGRLLRLSEILYRENSIESVQFMNINFNRDSILPDNIWDTFVEEFKLFYDEAEYYFPINNEDFIKIKHVISFGTLEKFKNLEDLSKYYKRILKSDSNFPFIITPKLDGVSCRLFYKNGKLEYATNRHNKEYGICITSKIINIVPHRINSKKDIAIRGELLYTGNNIKTTARNTISGILLDSTKNLINCIFVPYEVVDISTMKFLYNEFDKNLKFLENNKFIAIPYIKTDCNSFTDFEKEYIKPIDVYMDKNLKLYLERKKNEEYRFIETDGIVIQPNNYEYENENEPKLQIAYKFQPTILADTQIVSVSYDASYGIISPIINIKEVTINNKTIRNVTGSNFTYMKNNNYFIGSIVSVGFAGDVIPKIFNVKKIGDNEKIYPTNCPICFSKCEKITDKNIEKYKCTNENCPSYPLGFIKKLKNIYGLEKIGETGIVKAAKLISSGDFSDPTIIPIKNKILQIYEKYKNNLLALNLNYSIDKVKKNNLKFDEMIKTQEFKQLNKFLKHFLEGPLEKVQRK